MTDPIQLKTVRVACQESVIATLETLLEEARRGELISVYGIAEGKSGAYKQFGSATMSRLQTAGALLECAMDRLRAE